MMLRASISALVHVVPPKAPGRSSATVIRRSSPVERASVTTTSGSANSASFWRQPPQGGTGSGLSDHEQAKPGKLEVRATKPLANGRDLTARAYSPGRGRGLPGKLEITKPADPPIPRPALEIRRYTARGNLVAVVSNGTAVLGLGNIGALASKPVMEGKAVLFKKFANIDCFDIEVNEPTPRSWPRSSARWNPPSARSTSRTSRRPTASSSKSSAASG
jgi:hypothetical protein